MSLVADYSDTSSSSFSESGNEGKQEEAHSALKKPVLPSASSLFTNSSQSASEVFQTKYHREEEAKKACLEKHVKMVENDEHLLTKNGRKICWNYRKGRCRFGTKCQYAHDSDLLTSISATKQLENATNQEEVTSNSKKETNQSSRQKRPGLGDSITPGKRVMKAYKQLK